MASATTKTKPTQNTGTPTGLQRKVGPFPVWAWGALGLGGYYFYKKNAGATNLSTTAASGAVSPTVSGNGSFYGGSGYGGGYGNGGGSGSSSDSLQTPSTSSGVPAPVINTQSTPVSSGNSSLVNPVTQSGGTVGPTEIATSRGTVSTTNPNVKGYTVTGSKGTIVLGGALNNGIIKLSSPAQVKAAKAAGVTVGAGNTVKYTGK